MKLCGFTRTCKETWPSAWITYFKANLEYVRSQSQKADPYWRRIGLIFAQFQGLVAGYNARKPNISLTELDFWMLQALTEVNDVDLMSVPKLANVDREDNGHCTAIVMLRDKELFFGHDTWANARFLHAYLKEYNLNVPEFTAHRVSVSTRTGLLASIDDFWVSDADLWVFETTLEVYNETLFQEFCSPQSLLVWLRAYNAIWSSSNGSEWTSTFVRENSGTYNCQYVIADAKRAGQQTDLLWMVEQLPGHYNRTDVTKELLAKGYFESVNAPRAGTDTWRIAGIPEQQKKEPLKADLVSFEGQIREKVITRDAPHVKTYEEFKKLMRYNNYTLDPLFVINATGEREPAQGIMARSDLRPQNGTTWGPKKPSGGMDTKTIKLSDWRKTHKFDAELSPVWGEEIHIPPFSFDLWPNISHHGLVINWTFPWVEFAPGDICAFAKVNCDKIEGCGFCGKSNTCLSGTKDGPNTYFGYECASGWEFPAKAKPSAKAKAALKPWVIAVITVGVVLVLVIVGVIIGLVIKKKKPPAKYSLV
jgi:hypothetical protein